jgi:hypothetical protein
MSRVEQARRLRATSVVVAAAAGVVALASHLACRWPRSRSCGDEPSAGSSEPFDPMKWADCPGPHRIAMARELVDQRGLIGRPLAEEVELLGPIETDKNGNRGWALGEPAGSPSLMPNELMLAIALDASGHIATTRILDVFEGR